jgi:hypothetical protein
MEGEGDVAGGIEVVYYICCRFLSSKLMEGCSVVYTNMLKIKSEITDILNSFIFQCQGENIVENLFIPIWIEKNKKLH